MPRSGVSRSKRMSPTSSLGVGSRGCRARIVHYGGTEAEWTPPSFDDDDDDEELFWSVAAEEDGPAKNVIAWKPPAFKDDEADATFWAEAAALAS